jgi:hypothetical protein
MVGVEDRKVPLDLLAAWTAVAPYIPRHMLAVRTSLLVDLRARQAFVVAVVPFGYGLGRLLADVLGALLACIDAEELESLLGSLSRGDVAGCKSVLISRDVRALLLHGL